MSKTPEILQNPLTNKGTAFTANSLLMLKILKNIFFSTNCTTATKCCITNC